jgi:Holliday junction resolvase RusA-like endonuclease
MKLTILGRPITKSNSPRIGRSRTGKPFVLPSKALEKWQETAVLQLQAQHGRAARDSRWHLGDKRQPCVVQVGARALFYRPVDGPGDLDNYAKALGDALQKAGILANDRLIRSWDGSRLLIDRRNPRVEITLTPIAHMEATR